MDVKLVSNTQISESYLHNLMREIKDQEGIDFINNIKGPEGLIAYVARVSSTKQKNPNYAGLIR
jgi:hypothetical protein